MPPRSDSGTTTRERTRAVYHASVGRLDVTSSQNEEQLRLFMQRLLRDLQALEHLLAHGLIESDRRRGGAEQEYFLVDGAMMPRNMATAVLELLDDPHFVHELGQFNLEANLDPFVLGGDCFARLERQASELTARARKAARDLGGDAVICGILPTLRQQDVRSDSMVDRPRYRALEDALLRLRGGAFRLHIKGIDDLKTTHDSIMLEACNASFQVHFQVAPADFARYYNVAQAVAGPVMAAAVNSPLLFGRRLWRETRLALFQQSVDTRSDEVPERAQMPRVSFGTRWVKESPVEIYREDISRFPALIGTEGDEDPFEAIAAGRAPALTALRLHTGTVYRWNRACYGVGGEAGAEAKPHLRIENRILPAGPSVHDEVANAAFWFGLVEGVAREHGDPQKLMEFDTAKGNLLGAARIGLESQMHWLDDQHHPCVSLIRKQLLPLAEAGLEALQVDRADRERYLDTIRARVTSGQTGARWQLTSYSILLKNASPAEAQACLVRSMIRHQEAETPVHAWPKAELDGVADAFRALHEKVSAVMKTDLYTVRANELADLAANLMDWWHVRHVAVEDEQHRLVGLVTHRSLMRWAVAREAGERRAVPVSEIMERELVTAPPEMSTLDAIALMREKRIGCLPVVNADGRLIGMLSEDALVTLAAKLLDQNLRA